MEKPRGTWTKFGVASARCEGQAAFTHPKYSVPPMPAPPATRRPGAGAHRRVVTRLECRVGEGQAGRRSRSAVRGAATISARTYPAPSPIVNVALVVGIAAENTKQPALQCAVVPDGGVTLAGARPRAS